MFDLHEDQTTFMNNCQHSQTQNNALEIEKFSCVNTNIRVHVKKKIVHQTSPEHI